MTGQQFFQCLLGFGNPLLCYVGFSAIEAYGLSPQLDQMLNLAPNKWIPIEARLCTQHLDEGLDAGCFDEREQRRWNQKFGLISLTSAFRPLYFQRPSRQILSQLRDLLVHKRYIAQWHSEGWR